MRLCKDRMIKDVVEGELLQVAVNSRINMIAFFSSEDYVELRTYPDFKPIKRIMRFVEPLDKFFLTEELLIAECVDNSGWSNYSYSPASAQTKISPTKIAFHPMGTQFVVGYANGDMVVYELPSFNIVIEKNLKDPIIALQFMSNQILFVGTSAGNFGWYNTLNWRFKMTLKDKFMNPRMAICARKTKMMFVVDHKRHLKAYSTDTKNLMYDIKAHTREITDIQTNEFFSTVITSSLDGKIKMFDMLTGELKTTLLGHKDEVHSINVFDDERFMVSTSEDNSVKLWDLTRGRTLRTFFGLSNSLCTARHLSLIVMGDIEGAIKTWKIT